MSQRTPFFAINTFYHFFSINDPQNAKEVLNFIAEKYQVNGLIIAGSEGLNATVAAPSDTLLENFKNELQTAFKIKITNFKYSTAALKPFKRFTVKIRDEIVTAGIPGKSPDSTANHHLTPEQWDHVLKNERDVVLIDTRNWYEFKIGTFKGALNPNIEKFTEFPHYFRQQNIPKDKKILIFCTGGIRCEKGILELQDQGYDNVYQLQGGILDYLKEKPNQEFIGECFVFDNRVAVDQELAASKKYQLCPHCGQPAEIKIDCKRCDTPALVCDECLKLEWKKDTCSKNCAYQYKLHPERKGKHQVPFYRTKL